jgi:hypothetical protein
MWVTVRISNVHYLPGAGWDFGYDQQGREWVSVDQHTEDLEGHEVDECDVCGEHVEAGWLCKNTRQTVCDAHVEVDWVGYGEYTGQKDTTNP